MENSRKILIFSTAYYPFVGGAEVAIKEITDRIPGVQFDLITARLQRNLPKFEKKREGVNNINIHRVGLGIPILDKLLLPFLGARKAAKLNGRNKYNAYWCMMVSFASGAAYIANIFSKNKVPIILTLQEGDSEGHLKYKWLGLIHLSWRLALKGASTVTAISSYLAKRAERLGHKGEVNIIPNGVDVKRFTNANEKTKRDIREKFGIKESDVCLITTSRLTEKNAVEDIIKSLKDLPTNYKLLILGTGKLENRLKREAEKLKVENSEKRVIFFGMGSLPIVIEGLHSSDIFIRPSLSEGFGNSFIEAMAAGIPVIGTPVGGIVDFLKDGETGLFCKVNDPKSIADKVLEYEDHGRRSKIVENAKKLVEEKYDWNLIAKQMEKVFDGINSNKIK